MRRPVLAFLIAALAILFTQVFNWSGAVGFLFGWLLLVAVLTRRWTVEFVHAQITRLALVWPRWTPLRIRLWAQQQMRWGFYNALLAARAARPERPVDGS